jgi:hypothetical protein
MAIACTWWAASYSADGTVAEALEQGSTRTGQIAYVDPDAEASTTVRVGDATYTLADDDRAWTWSDVFSTAPEYNVGDKITVALDDDGHTAYDVEQFAPRSTLEAVLGLLFVLGLADLAVRYATRSRLLHRATKWQRWHTSRVQHVTVVEVRDRHPARRAEWVRHFLDMYAQPEFDEQYLVIEYRGRPYYFHARSERPITITPGMTLPVIGKVRHRGWIIALTEPPLYPSARLD